MLYKDGACTFCFGDMRDGIVSYDNPEFNKKPFELLRQQWSLEHLINLKQVHGTDVVTVTEQLFKGPLSIAALQGDALITNKKAIGCGVMTADCLPLVLYDPTTQVVGVIHAGWRGSVAGIVSSTLAQMHREFGVQPRNLRVYLGPCINVCCYQVRQDVVDQLSPDVRSQVIETRAGNYFLDLPRLNRLMLQHAGVLEQSIFTTFLACTHCTPSFHSFRRDGVRAGRQVTLVFLS